MKFYHLRLWAIRLYKEFGRENQSLMFLWKLKLLVWMKSLLWDMELKRKVILLVLLLLSQRTELIMEWQLMLFNICRVLLRV